MNVLRETKMKVDTLEILGILNNVIDPEVGHSIVEFGLVRSDLINVDEKNKLIKVKWIPTTPFCPLIAYISAVIWYTIKNKYPEWNVKVKLHDNVIGAETWNEMLTDNDKLKAIMDEIKKKNLLHYFIKAQ